MYNFQLNNTSVYLGGQCQWDLVLGKDSGNLTVDGFQLTPISENIPFNKKGEIRHLNDYHSDTIKEFYSDIKEDFWNTNSCLKTYQTTTDCIGWDQSMCAGFKRCESFKVYDKQYHFFLPLWLQNIKDGSYLEFRFKFSSLGGSNLGGRTLRLKTFGEDDENFHNSFVKYFNNWLKYIKVCNEDEKGNDRVVNINIKEKTASISGVSVECGQNTGEINCDYVISNLLNYERPNIETDYIITSMFKSHNTIVSQLFNFNFCFNLEDMISPGIMRNLYGATITGDVEVWLINEEGGTSEKLEKRSLFTNYDYIKKSSFRPFEVIFSGYVEPTYITDNDENVLSYLKDNTILDLKDKNKIVQYICHWGYPNFKDQTFNLYDGYKYIYENIDVDNLSIGNNEIEIVESEIPYTNGISIPYLRNDYIETRGDLSWVYPSRILWLEGGNTSSPLDSIKNIIVNKIINLGIEGVAYKNCVSIEKLDNVWGTNVNIEEDPCSEVCCIYLNTNSPVDNILTSLNISYTEITDKTYLVSNSGFYIIFTNDLSELILNTLIKNTNNSNNDSDLYALNASLQKFRESITKGNNGEFYGFGTEIGVGKDDLNNNIYYKLDTKSTYVYRKDGNIYPSILIDGEDDENLNFDYYYDVYNQEIKQIDYSGETSLISGIPEITLQHIDRVLVIPTSLSFINEQALDPDLAPITPLSEIIKDEIASLLGLSSDDDLVDYIYKLYYSEFTYEYEFSKEEGNKIKYLIKLTLI